MDDVLWVRRPWNLLCVVINDDVVSVRSGRMCCRLICPSRPPNVSLGRSRFFCFSCPVQKRLLPPWKPVKPSRNHYEKKSRQPARNTVNPKILLHSTEPQKKRAQFCWNQKKKPHEPRKSEIFRNKPYKISQDSPYTIEISVQLTKNEKSILKKGFSYINCISASSILKHNQRCLVHFLGKLLLLP